MTFIVKYVEFSIDLYWIFRNALTQLNPWNWFFEHSNMKFFLCVIEALKPNHIHKFGDHFKMQGCANPLSFKLRMLIFKYASKHLFHNLKFRNQSRGKKIFNLFCGKKRFKALNPLGMHPYYDVQNEYRSTGKWTN